MGGETSKFLRLETDGIDGCAGIADYQTNGDCAAGTGSFMDQQASRLLYDIEDVGDIVVGRRQAPPASPGAAACSPSRDMIHAQQKGYEPPEVLRGLCDAVIRNFKGTIAKGKVVERARGLHRRRGRQRGRRAGRCATPSISTDGSCSCPSYHACMGAVGAALIEADAAASAHGRPVTAVLRRRRACRPPSSP